MSLPVEPRERRFRVRISESEIHSKLRASEIHSQAPSLGNTYLSPELPAADELVSHADRDLTGREPILGQSEAHTDIMFKFSRFFGRVGRGRDDMKLFRP